MGTSDVHVLIDWDFFNNERESFHRPLTFIMSENRLLSPQVMLFLKEIPLYGIMI